jgi:exopolyphosphatase / guanosine-5'-triphosphate,3'-diphosphate pyrophosphatase
MAMDRVRRAVIDIGTNSIKLLVADVNAQQVQPVWESSKQTRLGKGFYQTRQLQPEAILQTAKAVAQFASTADELKSESIRIIATSAVREASNSKHLTDAIKKLAGLKVEILSGEQEADLVFEGVTTDPSMENQTLLLLDVGGGSTEFILGHDQHKEYSASVALGSVRLLETIPHSDPPEPAELRLYRKQVKEFLQTEVGSALQPILSNFRKSERAVHLVGTGGTAAILARMESRLQRYDRTRIEATMLSSQRIRRRVKSLWSLPLEKRKRIIGLPPSRADVILGGVVIYEAVMELFGFSELRISTRGLRFAAVRG